MKLKKILILSVIILSTLFTLYSDPVVRALTDKNTYKVDEIITLTVKVEDNDAGLHGLFFRLLYDDEVLQFENIHEGALVVSEPLEHEFLHAHTGDTAAKTSSSQIIVGYTLKGQQTLTSQTGTLATMQFRVIAPGSENESYSFVFDTADVVDARGKSLPAVEWEDSPVFTILHDTSHYFALINSPYENQVVFENEVMINALLSNAPGHYAVLANLDHGYQSTPIYTDNGVINGKSVPLHAGFNRIKLSLFNEQDLLLALDTVKVFKSAQDNIIKIIDPADHQLLNTDKVDVRVSSRYDRVTVNGVDATSLGEKDGDNQLYFSRIWLKKGFNRIYAEVKSPEGAIYTDEIIIFYQNDESIFRFVTPANGKIFKSTQETTKKASLDIAGEISTQYRETGVLNTVTVNVLYRPDNPYLDSRLLCDNRQAVIKESTLAGDDIRSPYMFSLDEPISLADLDSGELEITAYKNKKGSTYESLIHRYVYVDNSNHSIQLLQPNIYGRDILDTGYKIKGFNDYTMPIFNKLTLDAGCFALEESEKEGKHIDFFSGMTVTSMIEDKNGTAHALVNEGTVMKIYSKAFGTKEWQLSVARDDLYGYTLCETGKGILAGVSNTLNTGNSGLYLLQDRKLINVKIGEPISHVQFITNEQGTISLYGNDYSHLYSFNIFSLVENLEEGGNGLKAGSITKVPFDNRSVIEQFVLIPGSEYAVIRDNKGHITFYRNQTGTEYLPFTTDRQDAGDIFTHIVAGSYRDGDYTIYLLLRENNNNALSIMEHKTSGRLIYNDIDLGASLGLNAETGLAGAAFMDDQCIFMLASASSLEGSTYQFIRGRLLFDKFYRDAKDDYTTLSSLSLDNYNLVKVGTDTYYAGYGYKTAGRLSAFYKTYPAKGSVVFDYKNRDIDGFKEISFETDSIWLDRDIEDNDYIKLGITITSFAGSEVITAIPVTPLPDLIGIDNADYQISSFYDREKKKEVIRVTFKELQKNAFITFNTELKPVDTTSPTISNLTIHKKIPVKIPRSNEARISLPIRGFVTDPTVREININQYWIAVQRDGSFAYDYPLDSTNTEAVFNLYCLNSAEERAETSFTIHIFESRNGISDIRVTDNNDTPLPLTNGKDMTSLTEYINLAGTYYGLIGAVAGYELYDYIYVDGEEVLSLLRRGLFTANDSTDDPGIITVNDFPTDWILPSDLTSDPGTGYEYVQFSDQQIRLSPGRQRLVCYVENPGGLRNEYFIDTDPAVYPDLIYTMDSGEEEIVITNILAENTTDIYAGFPVDKLINITVNETSPAPYQFKAHYMLHGEIKSLVEFYDLKIRSYDPAVTFQNGKTEMLIPVDKSNRFSFECRISMPDAVEKDTYYLACIPTAPHLSELKKGVCLQVKKSFANTHIIPDFSPIDPANITGTGGWSEKERKELEKLLIIGFDRFIPDGTTINMVLNFDYEHHITGVLEKITSNGSNPTQGTYKVVNRNNGDITLNKNNGLRYGRNRIQWVLYYKGEEVSSSASGKIGMRDYLFYLEDTENKKDTLIDFPVKAGTYYHNIPSDEQTLPVLTINKDANTRVGVRLNDILVFEDSSNETPGSIDFTTHNVAQGRNYVTVNYREISGYENTLTYTFLYDTQPPDIQIASYLFDPAFKKAASFTVRIKESNLSGVSLFLGENQLSPFPTITYLGADIYEAAWTNLDNYDKLDIIPTTEEPLYAKAMDHAGNESRSNNLIGKKDVIIAQGNDLRMIDLQAAYYPVSDAPLFIQQEAERNGRPFPEHAKFYSQNITFDNYDLTRLYNEDRHGTVHLGGNYTIKADEGKLGVRSGRLEILPPFSIEAGAAFNHQPHAFDQTRPEIINIRRNVSADAMTFVFWLRYEEEPFYHQDAAVYRKILTIYENGTHKIYLAFNQLRRLYLLEEKSGQISPIIVPGFLKADDPDDWNLICLGVDAQDPAICSFQLAINEQTPVTKLFDSREVINSILSDQSFYYFGDKERTRQGHFSIAQPFYIDKLITAADLGEFGDMLDLTTDVGQDLPGYTYFFNTNVDNIGMDAYNLRPTGDFYVPVENADQSSAHNGGALIAGSIHKNLLKTNPSGQIVFSDADSSLSANMEVTVQPTHKTMTIKPKNSLFPGKYYFSNNYGNHGLQKDNWYSVSGEVVANSDETPVDGELVMIIDGVEKRFHLHVGIFHYIYTHNNTAPADVVMYIESRSAITLKQNMICNEGNYVLPLREGMGELKKSAATTYFLPQLSGTIEFYYKPYNVNKEGFVNYKSLFYESDFVKIGARQNALGHTVYYADIKTTNGIDCLSQLPVTPGWQHIQFSYQLRGTADKDVAYLYINGKIAGKVNDLKIDPSDEMTGSRPTEDNVYIGTGYDNKIYAEGYIDELKLSNFYKESQYVKREPISFNYADHPAPTLSISSTDPALSITDIQYCLETKDESIGDRITRPGAVEEHGFDIPALKPGRYRLVAQMLINGYRYHKIFTFTKDEKPHFIIRDKTELILNNRFSDVVFNLEYNDAYLMSKTEAVFAGAAMRIRYTSIEGPKEALLYICQNYRAIEDNTWLIGDGRSHINEWPVLDVGIDNLLAFTFKNIKPIGPVEWDLRSFYFSGELEPDEYDFDNLQPDEAGTISDTSLTAMTITNTVGDQYKIEVLIGSGDGTGGIFNEMDIQYEITPINAAITDKIVNTVPLQGKSALHLYYDDILHSGSMALYGEYTCKLTLLYRDQPYGTEDLALKWEKVIREFTLEEEKMLSLIDFSILYLDKEHNTAQLYLEYDQNALNELHYELRISPGDESNEACYEQNGELTDVNRGFMIMNDVPVFEGSSRIHLNLYNNKETGIIRSADIGVNYSLSAPEVVLTNTVPSIIAYNNVIFTWRGYHENSFKHDITYSYNFDNKGWSAYSSDWRKLELYNLAEGYHTFRVKALYNNEESPEQSATFFVDVKKPQFMGDKIKVEKIYGDDGIAHAVNITGSDGAIIDASLQDLFLAGEKVTYTNKGGFTANNIKLNFDGRNDFILTAYDRVGNFTDHRIQVDNTITEILYPIRDKPVRYAPMTVVGKIGDSAHAPLAIYLFDAQCDAGGKDDFSTWKKAKINEDRTFFVEDVFVNPGTDIREAYTPLYMAVVLESGNRFFKQIDVRANEMIMPIDMTLSTHAVEGENTDTSVTISCKANVGNISSWSIDFTGDGIYDLLEMVDDPVTGQSHEWVHTYSGLGLVKPRVRVISRDGQYFSVQDTIIIHEKIKEASNKLVANPLSLAVLPREDLSSRIFVLNGTEGEYAIDVYSVGRNDSYISNRLYSISLTDLEINNPTAINVLGDQRIIVAANEHGTGKLYCLKENDFSNYEITGTGTLEVDYAIHGLEYRTGKAYFTYKEVENVGSVVVNETGFDHDSYKMNTIDIRNGPAFSKQAGISGDESGLLLADFFNQRIIKVSDAFTVQSYFNGPGGFGGFGDGEGQFLKPTLITAYQNRIFIYDEARRDIQVFDPAFNSITQLRYNHDAGYANYLAPGFLEDLAGMAVITKEEGQRLYYYALLLSKTSGKLAMLRLPQWEELRAGMRNNKIVFIKDQEVYTAKPTGSDLTKLISTDSIPRIEGTIDYPALSPDGRKLVFTSRKRLYNGILTNDPTNGDHYAYDSLYVIDVTGENLQRIPLGIINNYEIERPVFNSNGDKLIFSAKTRGSNWQIYVYDFADGVVTRLFTSLENARFPYYSPDDRFVVFTTDYDGDEEIEIFDTLNPTVRVAVTANNARDSYPVWSIVYPYEIKNPDLDIESKIAFVSERDYHKGLYYTYIARPSDADLRVVKIDGEDTGDDPDSAALSVTTPDEEGDYPAFTGDGKQLVYEFFNGTDQVFVKRNQEAAATNVIDLPPGVRRPAGMKNMIANFKAEPVNGNEVELSWSRYTDTDIFYLVRFMIDREGESYVQKKVFTQNHTRITGLELGVDYLFKIVIMENDEEVAATQWKRIEMPDVVARPTYEIDEDNPYLVKFHAWKPENDTQWTFSWIINNQEITTAQSSQDFWYEFAGSGIYDIQLKTSNKAKTYSDITNMKVEISGDLFPVIEYSLAENSASIELDATASKGNKLDPASAGWTVSGPGRLPLGPVAGSKVSIPLDGFTSKIYVTLAMNRKPIAGQTTVESMEKTVVIDLDFKEIKPVITYEIDAKNERLFTFSGDHSLGNIDWSKAVWNIYDNGTKIEHVTGTSSFAYEFAESGNESHYSVSLTAARRNDGITRTASMLVSVQPVPIKPVIDYEILTIKNNQDVVTGAKILFSCSQSGGNNIDFTQARWNVPVAGTYNEQAAQVGPTAIYNLFGIEDSVYVEVSLTLSRRGEADAVTVTRMIKIAQGEVTKTEVIVNKELEETPGGCWIVFDVLGSRGPNIDWEKTEWLFNDNPYPQKGATAKYDVPADSTEKVIRYVCSLYTHGNTKPIVKSGSVPVRAGVLVPLIDVRKLPGKQTNVFELNVLNTEGVGIDWDKTRWYIFDGNENVITKQGASIVHSFALKNEGHGYPVMAEMFFKQDSRPFIAYKSVDVEGDAIVPAITWDIDREDPNMIHFSAAHSQGANIDWSKSKWTFGDSSESQYGAGVLHRYPVDNKDKTYRVSLTLTRTAVNQTEEVQTVYKTITIGSEKIKPVINAKLNSNGYLVLSAADSEGRGLMLDRSNWLFEGQGDNETLTINQKVGTVKRSAHSTTNNLSNTAGSSISNSQSNSNSTTDSNSSSGTNSSSNSTSNSSSTGDSHTWGDQHSVGGSLSTTIGPKWLRINVGASYNYTHSDNHTTSNNFSTSANHSTSSSDTTSESNSNTNSNSNSNTQNSSDSKTVSIGDSDTYDSTSYEGFIDNTNSFSSSNSHTGAVCRRYVGTYDPATATTGRLNRIMVTLFVYRADPYGGITGESITAVIDLSAAKQREGVQYE